MNIFIAWFLVGIVAAHLWYRGHMNEFGWSERTIVVFTGMDWYLLFLAVIMGPIMILIALVLYRKLCFTSKAKGLDLYDAKDMKKWGRYMGRNIAKEEGRLPEPIC